MAKKKNYLGWALGFLFFLFISVPALSLIYYNEDTDTQLFLVALAVQEMGELQLEGTVPEDRFTPGFYSQGRVAFYLQGKIKGEYLLKMAFDSDKPILETAAELIEPEEYYPVYGDESQLSTEDSSHGRLYVMLERKQSYLLYGNYSTGFNETTFANYDRTLPGTKAHYQREGYQMTLFDAKTIQIAVKDEFPKERCTGGTCDEGGAGNLGSRGPYYLSQPPVVEDTERVVIEVRDKNDPDEVLESTPQTKDVDYTINYSTGRIMFSTFVPGWDSNGNPLVIVVNYEAITPGKAAAHIMGGKAKLNLKENDSFEATYLQDDRTPAQTLMDLSTRLNLGETVNLTAEYAQSSKTRQDSAHKIELSYTPSPEFSFTTSYKQVRPDFADFVETTTDVEEYTVSSYFQLNENLAFSPYMQNSRDNVTRDPDEATTETLSYGADIEYTPANWPSITLGFQTEDGKQQGKNVFSPTDSTDQTLSLSLDNSQGSFPYTLELDRQDSMDHTNFSTDTSETGVTLTLPFRIGNIADAELIQEYISEKERETPKELSRTNRTTLSWETSATERLLLTGGYSFEDFLDFEYDERTQTHTASLLAESELTDELFLSSGYESQWVQGVIPSHANILSFILEYVPWEVLTLTGGYQVQWETTDDDSTTTYVYDFSSEYAPTLSFSASLIGSMEKGEDEIAQSISLSLEGKPYSDITLSGSFSEESTQETKTLELMTRSYETSLGLAYRPVDFDRFNALVKYETKTDEDRTFELVPPSTTILLAGEGIYDITKRFSIMGKYALKRLSEDIETTADMMVVRPVYRLGERFEIAGEYRILRHLEMENQEASTSFEVGYQLTDYLKLVGGYNFQGYQDLKLGEDEWKARGPYVRIICQL